MDELLQAVEVLLPNLYLAALFLYAGHFARESAWAGRCGRRTLVLAIVLHAGALALRRVVLGHFPPASALEAMSTVALATAAIYVIVEPRIGERTTGILVLVLVYPLTLAAVAFDARPKIDDPRLQSPWFVLHIAPAIFGYAGFALSSLYGLAYLLLHRAMKRHRFGMIYQRLPPLDALAAMNLRATWAGFLGLTAALVMGSVWASRELGALPFADPKMLLALSTWTLYGGALASRHILGWSARRLALLTMGGFLLILFSLVIVNLLLTGFHAFA